MNPQLTYWLALAVALGTSVGSVVLSLGLQLAACPLCYYQRSFAFASLGVLGVGLITGMQQHICLAGLVLPLALTGLLLAGYHASLEARGKMECPLGLTQTLTAPQESVLAFVVLSGLLVTCTLSEDKPGGGWVAIALAALLAVVLAVSSVASVAMPAPPKPETYQSPPKTCRPLPPPAVVG
ncbi:MAG: disulfide bond formation protein B [Gemmataceae bacterium]